MGLRALVAVGVAAATLVVAAAPAGAHALPQSSDPAPGATLKQAPTQVSIVFGETPDVRLSLLRVLDSAGQDHTVGKTSAAASDPRVLTVALGKLADGVYTVSWRTVSQVDGHLAAGTFAFGVGVTPTGTTTAAFSSKSPNPSALSVVSRWLLYAGLMVLVGGAFVALACYRQVPARLPLMLFLAAAVGLVGAAGITADSRQHAHLAWSDLLGSSLGHQFEWRIVPIVAAAAVAGAALLVRRGRPRRILVAAAGAAGLAAMWGDVEASHAAAAHTLRVVRMGDQWAHFAAAGVWAGGLAALLLTIGAAESGARVVAVKRFSTTALVSVAVIAATGFQRAYDEVGTLHSLVHAAFGQYVLVKIALLGGLVALGAVNRYRSVPALAASTQPLRRVGGMELIALAGVLAATAILQALAPPTTTAATAVHPLVLHGQDFGTTVRVTLTISPALAGFNQFSLKAADFDTGRPLDATASLRFNLPARPDLGSSTLALRRATLGQFAANGANLSIDGPWTVTVDLQEATGGVEIPFTVTPHQVPQKIIVAPQGQGLPTLYTLQLSANRTLQTYLDPAHPGFNEWHTTFIGADGNEIPMAALTDTATAPGSTAPKMLTVRRLDPIGHFVADLAGAVKGSYRFDVTGTTQTGDTIHGVFTIPVR
jgi:copper transport protein